MEVTRQSFSWHLPRMLKDLSECSFVALDLEFSGIALRSSGGPPVGNSGKRNHTIQERYQEVKAAAETYQILQVGLTFVEEDTEHRRYVLRPYNLHLNPVVDSRLDIDRRWSYQSSAVEFLMSNGFRMEAPFIDGIPYVSRAEEDAAKRELLQRQIRKPTIPDIAVGQLDTDAVQFVNQVRQQIDRCMSSGDFERERYMNVPNPGSIVGSVSPDQASAQLTLNNYQKLLVHQLVRAEYPGLVPVGRSTFVQIIPYEKEREEGVQEGKLRSLQGRLSKQTGFRWIVEAIVGGDLSGLDPWCFTSVIESQNGIDGDDVFEYSNRLQAKLKSRRPVLVGHNLFVDLVYLYRTFIGELPPLVEEFQQAIHSLVPLVVDTKYMATHNCGSLKTASSLMEVNSALCQRKKPALETHSQHSKYHNGKRLHEAGYDSLLTAEVLLRLSTELHERSLDNMAATSKSPSTAAIGESTLSGTPSPEWRLNSSLAPQPWNDGIKKTDTLIDIDEPINMTSLAVLESAFKDNNKKSSLAGTQQKPVDWKEPSEVARIRTIFAHPNKFDLLTDQTEEEVTLFPSNVVRYDRTPDPETPLLDFPEEIELQRKVDSGELIPRFDSEFWETYANKLRVFGTAEKICDLSCRAKDES